MHSPVTIFIYRDVFIRVYVYVLNDTLKMDEKVDVAGAAAAAAAALGELFLIVTS